MTLEVTWIPVETLLPDTHCHVWLKVRSGNKVFSRDGYYHPAGDEVDDAAEWRDEDGNELQSWHGQTVIAWAKFEWPGV
jgi:hypothetical protein